MAKRGMRSVAVPRGLPETWTGTPTSTALPPPPGAATEPTVSLYGLQASPLPGPVAEGYHRLFPWS